MKQSSKWLLFSISTQLELLNAKLTASQHIQELILMKQADLQAKVESLTAQVQKSRTEVQAAIDAAKAAAADLEAKLQEAIDAGDNVNQGVQDAIHSLSEAVQSVDDLHPDASAPVDPTEPTEPTEGQEPAQG